MKKGTRILLTGTGIAIMGLVAYSIMKASKDTVLETPAEEKTAEKEHKHAVSSSTQEFVERRKKRLAEIRAAREAAKAESAAVSVDNTDTEEKDRSIAAVAPEGTETGEIKDMSAVAVDPAE